MKKLSFFEGFIYMSLRNTNNFKWLNALLQGYNEIFSKKIKKNVTNSLACTLVYKS